MVDFADKGFMPVAGGVLEQSESFLTACRFVMNENAYWKAKHGIK